jgi:hypothetical protein
MGGFKDWRGTPIKVGSHVVYGTRSGSSLYITEGEVVEIKADDNYHAQTARRLDQKMQEQGFDQKTYEKVLYHHGLAFKLKVKRVAQTGGFFAWEQPGKVVTITSVERVTVVE